MHLRLCLTVHLHVYVYTYVYSLRRHKCRVFVYVYICLNIYSLCFALSVKKNNAYFDYVQAIKRLFSVSSLFLANLWIRIQYYLIFLLSFSLTILFGKLHLCYIFFSGSVLPPCWEVNHSCGCWTHEYMDWCIWFSSTGGITQTRNEVFEYVGVSWDWYVTKAVSEARHPPWR